jgi:hypothetical protein
MALEPTAGDPLQRGVSVRIGHAQPAVTRRGTSGLCIVGICPGEHPWLADLLPDAVVRDTRYRTEDGAIEHLRLRSRDDIKALPGLSGKSPSRVRDAVVLGLTAGAPEVDVILARCGDCNPWDLDRPKVGEMLGTFLDELHGAILAFPDVGGPVPTGPGTEISSWDRRTRTLAAVRQLAPGLIHRYQVGLIDSYDLDEDARLDLLRSLVGTDFALCGWSGDPSRMRAHGWRSAAAAVGGLLASDGADVGRGLVGRSLALPAGRTLARGREHRLGLSPPEPPMEDHDDHVVRLRLHRRREEAQILGEPTFRQPIGDWSVGALRAVKIVHRQLVRAADGYVFRNATDTQAAALAAALQRALRPFTNKGLIVGAGGEGPPSVRGGVDAIPGEPGLNATVTAQLRPWSQKVLVRVAVRPGHRPVLEVQ